MSTPAEPPTTESQPPVSLIAPPLPPTTTVVIVNWKEDPRAQDDIHTQYATESATTAVVAHAPLEAHADALPTTGGFEAALVALATACLLVGAGMHWLSPWSRFR